MKAVVTRVNSARVTRAETGEFGADMLVESVNNGPITILLDTREL